MPHPILQLFTNHVLTAMIYQVVCRRLMRADDWRFALRRSNGQCAPLFEQTSTSLPNMLPLWYWCICLSQFYLNLSGDISANVWAHFISIFPTTLVPMFEPISSQSCWLMWKNTFSTSMCVNSVVFVYDRWLIWI